MEEGDSEIIIIITAIALDNICGYLFVESQQIHTALKNCYPWILIYVNLLSQLGSVIKLHGLCYHAYELFMF